ncbi:hypothetical protein [Streptomyces sp. NRRL S-4]|uniref:hypothetical protein n=1 Tax=Streptomyces sp. NRRL S-4 TaxID=1519471 RepID=UPI00131B30BB|nr:hypothetical protein [Streptomyces sp. NRRL S-4]
MPKQAEETAEPAMVRVPVDEADPLTGRHEEYVAMPADAAQHWDARLWRRA